MNYPNENLNQTSSANTTYNNIGNILTNLEILGNNSNFDSSNFEIITSNYNQDVLNPQMAAKIDNGALLLDEVNQNMCYNIGNASNIRTVPPTTSYSVENIDTKIVHHNLQQNASTHHNHTITDISNTFLSENQRSHIQPVNNFQNILNDGGIDDYCTNFIGNS